MSEPEQQNMSEYRNRNGSNMMHRDRSEQMNIKTEYERSITKLSDSLRAQAAELERDFVHDEV